MKLDRSARFRTLAVHAGETPDPATGASAPNIVLSTSFVPPDASIGFSTSSDDGPFLYAREGNPTVRQLEEKLAALEGGRGAVAFGSGMAATSALLLHELHPGDHVVVSDVCYVGVAEFARSTLPRFGVSVSHVDLSDPELLRRAMTTKTRLVLAETPANPILRLTDIRAVADVAHGAGAQLAVDSTFATPVATRPLELGADFVIHSLTKYMNGHGDAMGGVVVSSRADLAHLRREGVAHMGGILSPFSAWLIMRGVATLPIRMKAHAEGAARVSAFLESHPRVTRVIYPGLDSHPQRELARRQMANSSGMLAFRVADGAGVARRLAEHLRVFHYTVSLGHHKSLVFYIATADVQTHSFRLDDEALARYRAFAGEGVFRVSVGLEDPEDLCEDLDQALG
jgi:cystathionine beta-lyase/cystathionine gamma-synthase